MQDLFLDPTCGSERHENKDDEEEWRGEMEKWGERKGGIRCEKYQAY